MIRMLLDSNIASPNELPILRQLLLHENDEIRLQALRLMWIVLGGSSVNEITSVQFKEELFYRLSSALNDRSPTLRKQVNIFLSRLAY